MRLRYMLVITAPILATSTLLLVVGGTGAWYVQLINKDVSRQLARNLECTLASEQVVFDLRDVRLQLERFIETSDNEDLRAAALFEENTTNELHAAEQAATTGELRHLAESARGKQEELFRKLSDALDERDNATKLADVRSLSRSITPDVINPAQKLLTLARQAATDHSNRSQLLADRIGLGLVLLGACGSVAGLMAGFGIARGIARRIESSEREAARSEQLAAVGQLAAGLAHELRNPLMAMRVLVEAGVESHSGSIDQRDLEVIDEEISRLEKLVDSFLEFARPPHLEKICVDTSTLIEPTLHIISGPARQNGAEIRWNRSLNPAFVNADPNQMRQVLLNLLLNAVEAVGPGGHIEVAITTQSQLTSHRRPEPEALHDIENRDDSDEATLGFCDIVVSDDGPGVLDEMKERIFEPFVSGRETGMGLGLAVSRRIVEAHGGTLSVVDNPGGGTRFVVRLPAARGLHSPERSNRAQLVAVDTPIAAGEQEVSG